MSSRVRARARPPVTSLLFVALAACLPSKFDGLSGGDGREAQEEDDASVIAADGGMDADEPESELDAEEPGEEREEAAVEGGLEAGAGSDAGASGPSDAGNDAAIRVDGGACMSSSSARPLRASAEAIELARLSTPGGVVTRILGPTVQLASARIWTFDSLRLSIPDTRPAQRPTNYPSSARDGASTPWTKLTKSNEWRLSELLDARGLPESLLTLNAAEQSLSDVTLFVAALLRDPAQPNNAFGFAKQSIGFFAPVSRVWLVNLTSGAATATRAAAPLFVAPEPLFGHAAVRHGTYFKLFACSDGAADAGTDSANPCQLARVPLARVAERAAYEFYTRDTFGTPGWSSDISSAAPVVNATSFAVSVSFNAYLQQFLMVYGQNAGNGVTLRSAPAPEGPWSDPVTVKQVVAPGWFNLNTREHESLVQDCGKRIIISTWSPRDGVLPDGGPSFPTTGDVVLSSIELQ
jgi:hypothetical protein